MSVYPAQVLRTSISSFCWVFARYIFHILVLEVYHPPPFPPSTRRNANRMDQWKAKREAVGENTTCVQTQTAAINLSHDETTQTDQHNSDAQRS
jgi:hypothetical protein